MDTSNNLSMKLVGLGGAGVSALNRLFTDKKISTDYCVISTDRKILDESILENKVLIGDGVGVGANSNLGRRVASQSENEIKKYLESIDILLLVAGLGGGTGTGASSVIADIAKKMDILTVGFFTMPFAFEGQQRQELAKQGLELAKEAFDIIFLVKNDRMLNMVDKKTPLKDAFHLTDNLILKIVDWIQNDGIQSTSEKLENNRLIEILSLNTTIEEEIENMINPKIERKLSEDVLNTPAFMRK